MSQKTWAPQRCLVEQLRLRQTKPVVVQVYNLENTLVGETVTSLTGR